MVKSDTPRSPKRSGHEFRMEADTLSGAERALVYRPDVPKHRDADRPTVYREPEEQLAEAVNLAAAIQLEVVDAAILRLRTVHPGTYVGKGKIAEIKAKAEANDIAVVIMDHPALHARIGCAQP